MQRRRMIGLGLAGAIVMARATAEEERGWFGMGLSVDVDGIFSPVLRSATVGEVTPGSPAAAGGLVKGDDIVELEGRAVAGAKAGEMKTLMRKPVGGALHLRLKRPSGQLYDAVLVAVKRPE